MKDMDVGIVPVVGNEQHRKVIGLVTDRDLCLEVIAEGREPQGTQVRECMTPTLVCCTADDDLQKALALMQDNQIRRIPVVDRDGIIEGMVSMGDVVQRAEISASRALEILKKVSEPTDQASKPRGQRM
jgi:CBS domain-containing protein